MAQPVQILTLQRTKLESFSQQFLDRDGKLKEDLAHAYQAETERAFVDNGGKRLLLASDVWGFSGWDVFVVNEFPDLESVRAFRERAHAQQYSRYFDQLTVPGIDRLKEFQAQEHLRRAHK